ncbi:hypothetical protein VV867_08740 [Pseudomonas sp. JH-2]|uniref:hypothetical protein n=1 Tax=Pseudomonas sp. JH-2 TaxID=3114998 RepID=UPI002E26795E|nr:hypothetical protein [Pseudomonas sp. JH-2]
MNMITTGGQPTMTSSELLDLVNRVRTEFGEPVVRRNVFIQRCKDELEGEHYKIFVVQNLNNTESEELELTRDQCMLVSMRESKAVRRRVVTKLNQMERQSTPPVELSRLELLEMALASEKEKLQLTAERDHAIATKAQIGSRREASAMARASAASREAARLKDELGRNSRHATVKAVEHATKRKFGPQEWRPLRKWCEVHGAEAAYVDDPLYGRVRAWPAAAWAEVHDIDLIKLFGHDELESPQA